MVEHSPVNAAEVGVEFQITVIEIRKARIFPEQSRFHRTPDDKHRRGRAVIGPSICIFHNPPAELAKGHQQHTIEISLLFEIGREGAERIIQFAHQTFVRVCLAGVGVESALARVINSRWQPAGDHARNHAQARRETSLRIGNVRFIFARDCENFVRT